MQRQITTNPKTDQKAPSGFLKIAGKIITTGPVVSRISVFCELCREQATGTRAELQASGWGITSHTAFCPYHQEMI